MPPILPMGMIGIIEKLGSVRLNAAAVTSGVLPIPAREQLLIMVNVVGFSAADIAGLRFNGDQALTYWDRHVSWQPGLNIVVNTQNPSGGLLRLRAAAGVAGHAVSAQVMNVPGATKSVSINSGATLTGAASSVGAVEIGGGEWVNIPDQITTVELRTAGGALMSVGSSLAVYGTNAG